MAPLDPAQGAAPALARQAQPNPIRTLFIANRGESAARIKRTADRLGILAVVPGMDGVPHVQLLQSARVVEAALVAGADALHPGYGFLSENADFAQAVEEAGIRWVGPPASAIRAMGNKASARRLAAQLGVPTVPGYDGDDQSDAGLLKAARRIAATPAGRPAGRILIKPAAGGGGKGMHLVDSLDPPAAFMAALARARREAAASFGDDRLVLELYLDGPRHVEIQVLFDARGNGVHLGERDCSLQRRHQKVLEESPSPAVDEGLRERLGEAALTLAAAVGYRSAGTCEFLLEDDGTFHFLEMNTRLQVEHPVTELVTGRDLVADQLRIAAGEPLGFGQAQADLARRRGGHAIEVRLYAEDAEAGFLPSTGRIEMLRWPMIRSAAERNGPVRVDAGIEHGSVVDTRFDPMLAKVIAGGTNRAEALQNLGKALSTTQVLGVVTNLRFLRWLLAQPEVVDGEARIDTLDRIWPPPGSTDPTEPASPAAWRTAALALARGTEGGWRLNGPAHLRLECEGVERSVDVDPTGQGLAVVVDEAGTAFVDDNGRSVPFRIAPPPDVDRAAQAAIAAAGFGPGGIVDVSAPMPGSVLAVHVEPGASVEAGQPLVTLEAMKMEHVVTAPSAGVVLEVSVKPGGQVTRGQSLVALNTGPGRATVAPKTEEIP